MFLGKSLLSTLVIIFITANYGFAAGGGDQYIKDYEFSFEGPLGSFDQNQLQRGF
jgi:ubiquinol-cytochrome c reductase cytochrome c1 subunit